MNTKGIKFLAVLAVLAMAFAAFAVIAPAEENDAAIPSEPTNVADATEFKAAIAAGDAFNIKLTAGFNIGTDAVAITHPGIIDFNGYTITTSTTTGLVEVDTGYTLGTNDNGNKSVIVNKSTNLTLKDTSANANGGISVALQKQGQANKVNREATIFNAPEATIVIESGKYQVVNTVAENHYDFWYTIKNLGTMTINGGTFVGMDHAFNLSDPENASSMISNGYSTPQSVIPENSKATLTINGGTFTGGLNNINNQGTAKTTINGGTFGGALKAVLFNLDDLEITGGTFTGTANYTVIQNGTAVAETAIAPETPGSTDAGKLKITGGTFTPYGTMAAIGPAITNGGLIFAIGDVTVSNVPNKLTLALYGHSANGTTISDYYANSSITGDVNVTVPATVAAPAIDNLVKIGTKTLTIGAGAIVTATGAITTEEGGKLVNNGIVVVPNNLFAATVDAASKGEFQATTEAGLNQALTKVNEVTVTANIELNNNLIIAYNKTVTISKDLQITTNDTDAIVVYGVLNSNGAYIYVDVYVDEEVGTFKATAPHNNTSSGTLQADTKVGYGDSLTISGTIPASLTVDVYGKMTTSDLTVLGTVNAYAGSDIKVTGTMTVSKSLVLKAGAKLDLTGTINVKNDNNVNAALTINAKSAGIAIGANVRTSTSEAFTQYFTPELIIDDGATVTIAKPTANTATNVVSMSVGAGAIVDVKGILNITGTLSGNVIDEGTVIFNGTSDDAIISLRDGTSITVTAVIAGTLTINDAGAVDAYAEETVAAAKKADGHSIVITNAKNVTAELTVDEFTGYVDKEPATQSSKYYTTTMNVSGALTEVTESTADVNVAITGANADSAEKKVQYYANKEATTTMKTSKYAKVLIDDLTLGKKVKVVATVTTVDGDVAAIADDSVFESATKITVNGNIEAKSGNVALSDAVNAVNYTIVATVESTPTTFIYYAGFDNALEDIEYAEQKTIAILGAVSTTGDVTLETGEIILVSTGATFTVKSKTTFEVKDGAQLNVSGTISVSGTLIIDNTDNGLSLGTITYDVLTVSGKKATYTSLANALANASAGDVITIAKNVTLSSAVTIPADVTVQLDKYTLTVSKTTLTVDGVLDVQKGALAMDGTAGTDTFLVVNNVVMSKAELTYNTYKADGVYYTAKNVYYIATAAYAAENIDEGNITIDGKASLGDVAFVAAEGKTINVTIPANAKVTADTVVLDGAVLTLTGELTGSVMSTVGIIDTEIALDSATGIIIANAEDNGVEYLFIKNKDGGSALVGDATIVSGVVKTNGALTVQGGNDTTYVPGSNLVVSSDAELVVVNALTVNAPEHGDGSIYKAGMLEVDGMLVLDGATATVNGDMAVTGDVVLTDKNTSVLNVYGSMEIAGTVLVEDEETGVAPTFLVGTSAGLNGKVVVGTPGLAGTPAIVGKVTLNTNAVYLMAYPGADMTMAKINWVDEKELSSAVYTDVYFKNSLYATIYAKAAGNVTIIGNNAIINKDTVKIPGLDTSGIAAQTVANDFVYWYTDYEMRENLANADNKVGTVDAIYYKTQVSSVTGKIATGTGYFVTIDGFNEAGLTVLDIGTHTVALDIAKGYTAENAAIYLNGIKITNGTFALTEGMDDFVITVTGVEPTKEVEPVTPEEKAAWGITEILLVVLIVLIAVMVIVVIMRMNRS